MNNYTCILGFIQTSAIHPLEGITASVDVFPRTKRIGHKPGLKSYSCYKSDQSGMTQLQGFKVRSLDISMGFIFA